MAKKKRTTISNGNKGGIGKSQVTNLLVTAALDDGEVPVLVETDNGNPDTYRGSVKALGKENVHACDIETVEGWHKLVDICLSNKDRSVIVNGRASDISMLKRYGEVFEAMEPEPVFLWTVFKEESGPRMLSELLKLYNLRVCVVLNEHDSSPGGFEDWEKSELSKHVPSVRLPDNNNAEILLQRAKNKCTLREAYETLNLGEKMFADIWLKKALAAIRKAVEIADFYKK
ncbi:MAG: hypothetical protein K6F46_06135 [Desulfovibrio sp.]|nr:hypothetical protein [Desulfovibrio sp.]